MGPRTRSLGLDAATVVAKEETVEEAMKEVVEEAVEEFVRAEYR